MKMIPESPLVAAYEEATAATRALAEAASASRAFAEAVTIAGSAGTASRVHVGFRIGASGLSAVDARAAAAGVDRSEMLRRMLAFAEKRMPR